MRRDAGKDECDPISHVALFAERPGGTGKKVKDCEIDVATGFSGVSLPYIRGRLSYHHSRNAPQPARAPQSSTADEQRGIGSIRVSIATILNDEICAEGAALESSAAVC